MIRQAFDNEKIDKATFIYRSYGPGAVEHNYLCAVCRDKPAVLETHIGTLQPCWDCQSKYRLIKLTWVDRLLGRKK